MSNEQGKYFEPDSRVQLLDKVHHLSLFSDFLVLVTGDTGAGKTMLFNALTSQLAAADSVLFTLPLSSPTDSSGLLIDLSLQLPEHAQAGDDAEKLASLNAMLQVARKQGQRAAIVVDNADLLTEDGLELLLNLQFNDDNADGASPQVVLFGGPKLLDHLADNGWITALSGRMHHEQLLPYTEEEFGRYLQFRGVDETRPKVLKKLYKEANGYPGRIPNSVMPKEIKPQTDALLKASSADSLAGSSGKGAKRAFPFSPLLMGCIGVFLLGVLGVAIWQFSPKESLDVVSVDEGDSPISLMRLIGSEVSDDENQDIDAELKTNETILPAPSELSKRLAEQESKLLKTDEVISPAEAESLRETNALMTSTIIAEPVDDGLAKGLPPVPSVVTGALPLPAVEKTVVISSASKEKPSTPILENVVEPVESLSKQTVENSVVETVASVVPVSVAESVELVAEPIAESPIVEPVIELKETSPSENTKPSAPPIFAQIEAKVDASVPITVQETPQPKQPEVKSTQVREKVAKQEVHGNNDSAEPSYIIEGERDILSWPAKGYSLQMIGAREVSSVDRFYQEYGTEGYHAFSTNFKGRPFYVIVYGQYETRRDAAAAVALLPEAARKLKPWARTIKGIQNDIRK